MLMAALFTNKRRIDKFDSEELDKKEAFEESIKEFMDYYDIYASSYSHEYFAKDNRKLIEKLKYLLTFF